MHTIVALCDGIAFRKGRLNARYLPRPGVVGNPFPTKPDTRAPKANGGVGNDAQRLTRRIGFDSTLSGLQIAIGEIHPSTNSIGEDYTEMMIGVQNGSRLMANSANERSLSACVRSAGILRATGCV